MQRLLNIVSAWSNWVRVPFNVDKCWYYYKTYQGKRAIHLDVELTLNSVQLRKADPQVTMWHLGIPVQLNQLCGSGGRSTLKDESTQFLLSILQVEETADLIVLTNKLNPVNAIELLDSMAKAQSPLCR